MARKWQEFWAMCKDKEESENVTDVKNIVIDGLEVSTGLVSCWSEAVSVSEWKER